MISSIIQYLNHPLVLSSVKCLKFHNLIKMIIEGATKIHLQYSVNIWALILLVTRKIALSTSILILFWRSNRILEIRLPIMSINPFQFTFSKEYVCYLKLNNIIVLKSNINWIGKLSVTVEMSYLPIVIAANWR